MNDFDRPGRRSIRLPDFDYSQAGAYFVTICTLHRRCLLGAISGGQSVLSSEGLAVERILQSSITHFTGVRLDCYIVMPNHLHAIFELKDSDSESDQRRGRVCLPSSSRRRTLADVIARFKFESTKVVGMALGDPSFRLWQRNYYEHVIRNEIDLETTRNYIIHNAQTWNEDKYFIRY